MNTRWAFSLLFVLVLLLAAAGCTQPAAPPVTPVPTAVETTEIPTPAPVTTTLVSLTPGPTQTLPDMWSLEIQVASNGEAIDPQIITTVAGGKGLNAILQIDVKVTRSDGVVETGVITKPLTKGKSVAVRSTTAPGYKDRAEVWATNPQGEKVKIFDAYVPFRSYN
jgi:ABC-type glycerol-3-phosphate transport system substrate-binding protein